MAHFEAFSFLNKHLLTQHKLNWYISSTKDRRCFEIQSLIPYAGKNLGICRKTIVYSRTSRLFGDVFFGKNLNLQWIKKQKAQERKKKIKLHP